ncbi:MAG: CCA tRNA nucleotidyltransferase [Flammeovirgaceae bacterium]
MNPQYQAQLKEIPVFATVAKAAANAGVQVHVVGGFVRDLLLRRPCKDIDFVCQGSGIALAKETARLLQEKQVTVFNNFGTANIKHGDLELEFVGARKESYRTESRKPIVEDGTFADDQNRRDFTINALAISLNENNFGELIDPFGGVQHLKEKIIQTPLSPDITFSDDPLRMMRAIRFASQLKFDIEADTFASISKNKDRLKIVSMERVTDELNKIILSPVPSYGFKLLFQSGLLIGFFPEMIALHGVDYQDNKAHKDNFYHTLQVLDNVSAMSDDLRLRWAAILHDIAKPLTKRFDKDVGWTFHGHEDKGARMVPGIFKRLKLPLNEKMFYVQKLVKLHLRPIALSKEVTDSAVRRLLFEAGDHVEDLMKLCRADITSKNADKVTKYLRNFENVEQKIIDVEAKDHVRNFQPPISGSEIMEWFELPPSKIVGELKDQIKEAVLEGEINNNREEAYQFLVQQAAKKGLTLKKLTL